MEARPVQRPPLSDSGGGGGGGGGGGSGTQERSKEKGVKMEEEEEGSPSIKLGVEKPVNNNNNNNNVMKQQGKRVFTAAQVNELQIQALIYKYIAGGIPVPLHLVVPIWESVASSLPSAQHYPSFVGISYKGFDYRNFMEPEPERCRRTDGKKWRCSKNVIPDQKYCEQHMHRGRQRSRKLVESSQSTLPDLRLSKNPKNESENSKTVSAPLSFKYKPSSCDSGTSHNISATAMLDSNNVCRDRNSNATSSTNVITATNDVKKNHCKMNKNFPGASEEAEQNLSVCHNNIICGSSKSGNNAATGSSNVSPGVGFSPKSVLQVLGCSRSRVYKDEIELEPGRCKRTDGKKWRCSRDVIPDQKYCARHMHRGAKKHVEVSHPVANPTVGDGPPSRLTKANKAAYSSLSTSLSISIQSPQLTRHDEKSVSSGSETTISDTTINVFGQR